MWAKSGPLPWSSEPEAGSAWWPKKAGLAFAGRPCPWLQSAGVAHASRRRSAHPMRCHSAHGMAWSVAPRRWVEGGGVARRSTGGETRRRPTRRRQRGLTRCPGVGEATELKTGNCVLWRRMRVVVGGDRGGFLQPEEDENKVMHWSNGEGAWRGPHSP
jgi:hypothetical protein